MFQRKVVRYRSRHAVLLFVLSYDDHETFCKDDIQILQWISLFLLAHAPIADIRTFSEHCELVFSASFANFQIRRSRYRQLPKATDCFENIRKLRFFVQVVSYQWQDYEKYLYVSPRSYICVCTVTLMSVAWHVGFEFHISIVDERHELAMLRKCLNFSDENM